MAEELPEAGLQAAVVTVVLFPIVVTVVGTEVVSVVG